MSHVLQGSVVWAVLAALCLSVWSVPARTSRKFATTALPSLSARDVGEYAAVPWREADQVILPGTREDRVQDLNLSVASVKVTDTISADELDDWAQLAQWGQEQNQILLLRLYFWTDAERYQGEMEDVEVYWNRLNQFLAGMEARDSLAACYAVVLAEENIWYNGRADMLTELYQRIKASYDVPVWQWYTPYSWEPSSGGWIPADGWVIDPYFLPNPEFRQYLRKYLIAGKPVIVMPWATSQPGVIPPMTDEQWEANNEQLETAVEFNLPVAFYWTYGTTTTEGTSCHFGCDRENPPAEEIDDINQWVFDYTDYVRTLPADYTGAISADRFDADPAGLALTNVDGVLTYQDDFSTLKCIDEASMTGFRDLVMDGQTLTARGFLGRSVNATLTYHFTGVDTLKSPTVTLKADIDRNLAGGVQLALSKDGKNWRSSSIAKRSGTQTLTFSSRDVANVKDFWVQIRFTGNAGTIDASPVRIDDLKISSTVAKGRR